MSITIEELRKMDAGTYQLIDIRSESEIAHGAIPGATAIPGEKIADSELTDKGKKLIICCSRGRNSVDLATELCEKGYDAESLEGGYVAWLMDYMKRQEEADFAKNVEQSLRKTYKKRIWSRFCTLPSAMRRSVSSQSQPSTPPVLKVRFLPYISPSRPEKQCSPAWWKHPVREAGRS